MELEVKKFNDSTSWSRPSQSRFVLAKDVLLFDLKMRFFEVHWSSSRDKVEVQ